MLKAHGDAAGGGTGGLTVPQPSIFVQGGGMRIDSEKWNEETERQREEDEGGFGLVTWLAGLMAVGGLFLIWYMERPL